MTTYYAYKTASFFDCFDSKQKLFHKRPHDQSIGTIICRELPSDLELPATALLLANLSTAIDSELAP